MSVNINDITITSLETITAFDIATGYLKWILDELQNAKIANTQEKTDITGKQGRKLTSLKKNKAVTISGSHGLVSGGLMATQVGGEFKNGITDIVYPDYLTVKSNKATTTYKAVGTTGNEIASVYILNADGTRTIIEQGATAVDNKFSYDPETKAITFASGKVPDGTEILAYYHRKVRADYLENMSDNYSEKVMLYIDAFGEDKCSNVYHVQFYIPKADFEGNFDIDMGDNQTVHGFEAQSLTGGCGLKNGMLWRYTIFGEDTEDAA